MKLIGVRPSGPHSPIVITSVRNNYRPKMGEVEIPTVRALAQLWVRFSQVGQSIEIPCNHILYKRLLPLLPKIDGDLTLVNQTAGLLASTIDDAIKHYGSELRKNGVSLKNITQHLRKAVAQQLIETSR